MVVNNLYQAKADDVAASMEFSDDFIAQVLHDIYRRGKAQSPTDLSPELFRAILRRFNEATAQGMAASDGPDMDDDFRQALRHSNEVFSAFKVHRMQSDMARLLTDSNGDLKPFNQWANDVLPIASHQCGAWLRTEYDTAVVRAHQAADWQQFLREADVLPNLKWMPSTSPNPGADHQLFWNTVRPINDPFWNEHRPGDRWNCKCSLTSTDEPCTATPSSDKASNPQPGLDSNPGTDGAVFAQSHPYFPKSCSSCSFYKPGFRDKLSHLFNNKAKDCYNCPYINNCLDSLCKSDKPDKEKLKANRVEYKRLLHDPEYKDVVFDKRTGGLKAAHIGHITHEGEHAQRFFGGLTSSDLENECQNQLFSMGHKAIFCNETKKKNGQQLAALDMVMDDKYMDIRSVTGRGWYSNIFVKKNDQLRRYNSRSDVEEKADALCLYFHDPNLFDETKMKKSINYFKFYRNFDGNLLDKDLKHIYCVIKGRNELLHYEI